MRCLIFTQFTLNGRTTVASPSHHVHIVLLESFRSRVTTPASHSWISPKEESPWSEPATCAPWTCFVYHSPHSGSC